MSRGGGSVNGCSPHGNEEEGPQNLTCAAAWDQRPVRVCPQETSAPEPHAPLSPECPSLPPTRNLGVTAGDEERKRGALTEEDFLPEKTTAVRHEDGRGGHCAEWNESGKDAP